MNKKIKKTYKLAEYLFPEIDNYCKNCNTCCNTYGWLIDNEVDDFLDKKYSVFQINKTLHCLDSFVRDKNNKIIINKIPKCLFYKKNRCLIYSNRPLDCRLYPIKIKFKKNKIIVGLSLGCKYVSSLSEKEKVYLCARAIVFLKKAPQEIINNYLNIMKNVNSISDPKNFQIKNIVELKEQNGRWKILE